MHTPPKTGEVWRHYKTGGNYEIISIGKLQVKVDSLDMKDCVVYKALSDNNIWCRPLEDFIEEVVSETGEKHSRFSKIS